MIDALTGVLLIPALAACLLAALPGYRLTSRLNVLAALLTLLTAASLFVVERPSRTSRQSEIPSPSSSRPVYTCRTMFPLPL